jgi:hypothetical protein
MLCECFLWNIGSISSWGFHYVIPTCNLHLSQSLFNVCWCIPPPHHNTSSLVSLFLLIPGLCCLTARRGLCSLFRTNLSQSQSKLGMLSKAVHKARLGCCETAWKCLSNEVGVVGCMSVDKEAWVFLVSSDFLSQLWFGTFLLLSGSIRQRAREMMAVVLRIELEY